MTRNSVLACLLLTALPAAAGDCVILLHGLARTAGSMEKMARAFEKRGFTVANIDYPSTRHSVEMLAPMAVEAGIAACPILVFCGTVASCAVATGSAEPTAGFRGMRVASPAVIVATLVGGFLAGAIIGIPRSR